MTCSLVRFVVVVAMLLAFCASPCLAGGPPCVTKDGWYFGLTEKVIEMATHFAVQGDKAAFEKLIRLGQLRPLKAGVRVYIEPGGGVGIRAVRVPGGLTPVYVVNEALDCHR